LERTAAEESDCISELKQRLLVFVNSKFVLHEEHQIATLLYPSFKKLHDLDCLNLASVRAAEQRVRLLIDEVDFINASDQSNDSLADSSIPSASNSSSTTRKRSSPMKCILDQYCPKRPCNDELVAYLEEPTERMSNSELLNWWKEKSSRFPRLSSVARKFMAIPASSAASESVFSTAGRTITDLRSRLNPETVSHLMFINWNG
jgi:hypothetical protein